MGWLADMIPVWEPTCETDFLSLRAIAELPSDLQRDPSDYDFQVVQITLRNILIEHEYFQLSFSDQGAWERFFDECRERLFAPSRRHGLQRTNGPQYVRDQLPRATAESNGSSVAEEGLA